MGYAYSAILGLTWQGDSAPNLSILGRYAKELESRLRLLSATDFVGIAGAPVEEILIEIDHYQLVRLGLSIEQVAQKLSQADSKVSAGEIISDQFKAQIEITGAFTLAQRLASVPIVSDANGQLTRLEDIATIKRQSQTPASEYVLINGEPGIMVAARMLANNRIDIWGDQVSQLLAELEPNLPSNVKVEWLFDQRAYTNDRLGSLIESLGIGFILILGVLIITLGYRNAIIVAIALPLTALFTLICMRIVELPIHQMSITGLVVALGIMVDNAIVIVDSIASKKRAGNSAVSAPLHTLKHFWLPLAGSTLTTILAFAPIALMPGAAGEFVGGIAISVMFALVGSFIISHTLIAGLAGKYYVPSKSHAWYNDGIKINAVSKRFEKLLFAAFKHPKKFMLALSVLPMLGFINMQYLTEQFFPASDRDIFQIEVFLPYSSSIEQTHTLVKQIDKELSQVTGITRRDWTIGNNTPSFYYNLMQRQSGANFYAQAMVTTDHFDTANDMIWPLQQQLEQQFPQAQILVRKLEQGPPFNAPVELRIYGPSLETLTQLGNELRLIMSAAPDLIATRVSLSPGTPKLWLDVNEEAAQIAGLSLTQIARQMQLATTGINSASVLEQTQSLPLRLKISDYHRSDVQKLLQIKLTSPSGQSIPLSAIAKVTLAPTLGGIPRREGQRVNVIEGCTRDSVLPALVLARVSKLIEQQDFVLPQGYKLEIGGESQTRDEAVNQ